MFNVRLQARNAIIRAERERDPAWNPFLRGRKWVRHDVAVEGDMEDGQEIMYQMNSDACVGPSKPEVLTVASPRVFEPMMTAAPRSDDPAVELRADATSEARARKPLQGFQSKATEKPKGELKHWQYTFAKQSLAIFCSSWLSILLPFVPAGFVVEYTHLSPLTTFAINFIAIFPVAAIVAMAMDELMMRVGNTLGVLIYMSFGNVVQLVTSILLLKTRQVAILQTSLIGSILGGVILVTGASFFAGGLNRTEQFFNTTTATTVANFLMLSVASLIVPTASHLFTGSTTEQIAGQSRGTSIVLLLAYGSYVFFQLKSHSEVFGLGDGNMYTPKSEKSTKRPPKHKVRGGSIAGSISSDVEPELHIWTALITLVVGTTLLAFNTSFAVDSVDGLTQNHVSQSFVGLILLPFLNNDLMPLKCALMEKLDLSIMASAGKSLQTCLLITPLIVIIAWILEIDEMGLLFDGFQVASLFVAVLLFRFQIADGKSNYLQGVLLLSTYIIIAIAAWYN